MPPIIVDSSAIEKAEKAAEILKRADLYVQDAVDAVNSSKQRMNVLIDQIQERQLRLENLKDTHDLLERSAERWKEHRLAINRLYSALSAPADFLGLRLDAQSSLAPK